MTDLEFDGLIDAGLRGELSWREVRDRTQKAKPRWEPLPKPAWHAGASTDEVLGFRLAPGYEAGVRLLDEATLVAQLALAVAINAAGRASPWLVRYTALLVAQRRQRRGVA